MCESCSLRTSQSVLSCAVPLRILALKVNILAVVVSMLAQALTRDFGVRDIVRTDASPIPSVRVAIAFVVHRDNVV